MSISKRRRLWSVPLLLVAVAVGTGGFSASQVAAQESTAASKPRDTPKPRTKAARSGADMVITGNEEAPQVLTIVPWQEPQPKPPPALSIEREASRPASAPMPEKPVAKSAGTTRTDSLPLAPVPDKRAVSTQPAGNTSTSASTLPAMPSVLDSDLPIAEDPLARPLPIR